MTTYKVIAENGESAQYVDHDACVYGPYGGAGSVGAANIQVLRDEYGAEDLNIYESGGWEGKTRVVYARGNDLPEIAICYDRVGTQYALFRTDSDKAREVLDELGKYPCLDDELLSEIEWEWAVQNDEVQELESELVDQFVESGMAEEAAKEHASEAIYRALQEGMGDWVITEYDGAFVDPDALREATEKWLEELAP